MIESKDNKTFKMLKSLLSSRGIKKEQKCLISGSKIVPEHDGESIFYEGDCNFLLSKDLFNELDVHNTKSPLLLSDCPVVKEWDQSIQTTGIEVLLPAGDPKNLGALIRTCMAFSVSKIILLKESAHPFLPEVIKTSAGSVLKAPLYSGPFLKDLKPSSELWTMDANGKSIDDFKAMPMRLLLGEEGGNLPPELLENSLSIRISDQVESLNVNSALSIALYKLFSSS